MTPPNLISVVIASPLQQAFYYFIPDNNKPPPIGARVSVPFGHRKATVGIVVEMNNATIPEGITPKSINEVLDEDISLTPEILQLCDWCSHYYHHPLGEVCHAALPAWLRKPVETPTLQEEVWVLTTQGENATQADFTRAKKQYHTWQIIKNRRSLNKEEIQNNRISIATLRALQAKGFAEKIATDETMTATRTTLLAQSPPTLNHEQAHAVAAINRHQFGSYLLDGITGSGKTEVYLQVITQVLESGRQVLVLVPEIGLTPQTLKRFKQRFNIAVHALHSRMTDKQRVKVWRKAKEGKAPIIIGTRSAVFTPFPNLGLIVIDEEHDTSYKQQEGMRYSARELSLIRAQKQSIPIILGSATPSLETLHNAYEKRFTHLKLRTRATMVEPPNIRCVTHNDTNISDEIIEQIETALNKRQQVLVFINRRGYAPTLMCQQCGWISECSNCDSRMTLHQQSTQHQYLHCHQCDTRAAKPSNCPTCHSTHLAAIGSGTQRNEEYLQQQFPQTPIFRIDRDSTHRKGHLETILETVNNGEPCILIGTQMLAKGHHFKQVSLVVVLGIDSGFFSSDFRGMERMAQLLTQVAGRAGREQHQGTVLMQTQFAQHPLLKKLLAEGYEPLAEQLLAERQLTQMPPYQHMAMIRCHAPQAAMASEFLDYIRLTIEYWKSDRQTQIGHIQCIGPMPCMLEKRNNRYHYQLQIKSAQRRGLHDVLNSLHLALNQYRTPNSLSWFIDVDPQEV